MMHSDLAILIGQHIVERRAALRMSQKDLAKILGFSPQFMGQIERGLVMIPESSLVKVINVLNISRAKMKTFYRKASLSYVERLYSRNNTRAGEGVALKK